MFGIGANELVLILIFGFIVFGPDKLPAMAKTIGQAIARFRRAQNEMSNVIKNEVYDPDSDEPFKNPLDAMARIEKKAQGSDREESFSENKARYDRQREAQKRNEERKAQLAAKKAQARARMEQGESPLDGEGSASRPVDAQKAAAPAVSVEELYGVAPVADQPAISVDELYGIPSSERAAESAGASAESTRQNEEGE